MRCLERLRLLRVNFLLFCFFFFLFSSLSFGAEIFLKSSSRVSGQQVSLGEIAEIKGTSVEKNLLSSIKISDLPPPCGKKSISKEEVARRIASYLRDNGVVFKKIVIKGSERVLVTSPCLVIDGDHIRELVEEFFKKNYPQYEVVSVPNLKVKLSYTSYEEHLSLKYLGRNSARFVYEITVNGKPVKKFWLPVRVERKVKVVVAVRPIPRGSVITADKVSLKEVVESKARGGTDNLSSVVGATAKRDFLPGDVITERGIVPNFAVKKNQPVRVVYRSGAIRVELLGIALQNGIVGNIIKVKNPSTGKVLLCRVTGSGLVEFVSR